MEPSADLALLAADPEPIFVEYAKTQPEYQTLPALVWRDGRILTEWIFSEEERARVARGENLQLWIWTFGQPLQPVALAVTDEHHG
jgi:hypothetical protein